MTKRNPDVYPTFAEQYTDEDVPNNSLVVECGDRYRYISYDDIYLAESSVYSYSYSTSFDGEGAITSAIDYVTTEDLPQLYVLEGHGEAETALHLLGSAGEGELRGELPVAADRGRDPRGGRLHPDLCSLHRPVGGGSDHAVRLCLGRRQADGQRGPRRGQHPDQPVQLLEKYGITAAEGIVVDQDREHYAFGMPYVPMPDMASSDITDSLLEENYYVLMPISLGLTVGTATGGTVTELMTTSDSAFSKVAGYSLTTYDKEDGDIDGPFTLAVSIEDEGGGKIVWFSSSAMLEDMYNAYSSGANVDLAMNSLSWLVGEREAIAIRSKSLNYNYLTISSSTSSVLKGLMIGVFPLAYLAIGIGVILRKRKVQNETV